MEPFRLARSVAGAPALAWRLGPGGLLAGLVLGLALLVGTTATCAPATNTPVDFSAPADSAFTNGLPAIRERLGLRDMPPGFVATNWQANLCLVLGFRVDIGPKQYANLIEITTLPVETTPGTSRSKLPPAAVLDLKAPADSLISTNRVYHLTSPRYPVRVRVYDEKGAFLKESREHLPWSFLTNGLNRGCLARLTDTNRLASPKAGGSSADKAPAPTNTLARSEAIERQLRTEREVFGGLTAMVTLFADTLGASALDGVRDHAYDVVRKPSLLKIIADMGLNLNLEPRFDAAALLPAKGDEPEPRAWLPVELKQGDRLLVPITFVTASTAGPHFLTGGIRALRAVHPLKPERRLLAQVLAVGEVTRQVPPTSPGRRL